MRGSLPPNSANRRLADRAISASSPARTRAVFSAIPESLDASLRSLSSIFNVDLICINMHELLHTSQGWVVPPNQAEIMCNAVREKGLPCAYIAFEGEQHGFRRAENIKRALDAELFFFKGLWLSAGGAD
jgi:acetyl esterase/lipase